MRRGHHGPTLQGTVSPGPNTPCQSPGPDTPGTNNEGEGTRRIQLDQVYAYRSLDKVSGLIDHANISADRLKVHLVGTTHINQQRFISGAYRTVEKSWDFLRLTKKLALAPDASPTTVFSFRLPEALLETHCPLRNPFHLLLPPTVGTKREDGLNDMSPRDPVNAKIEYTIVAEFFRDGVSIHKMRKPFRVAPRHFASPHTMNPPPGYDEIMSVEEEVHRTIGGKVGSLKIVGQQPPALLTSLEEHQITTRVPLTVEFHSNVSTPPPKIQGIGIKLRATTNSRVEHMLEEGEDVRRFTDVRLNKIVFSKNSGPVWRPAHRPRVWLADLEIPVTLCPKGFVAIPEFESCLVDRRYALTLKFELASTGIPLSETRVTIPAWIFADEYYGIPSEARPGVTVKTMKRFSVPLDVEAEGPGSLPNYEDSHLLNLASGQAQGPVIVGDEGTSAAPFSLTGREPDYFARPTAVAAAAGAAAANAVGATTEGGRPRNHYLPGVNGAHQTVPSQSPFGARSSTTTTTTMELEGIDPTEQDVGGGGGVGDGDPVVDEETRVPAWMLKNLQAEEGGGGGHRRHDPRDQDGAQ